MPVAYVSNVSPIMSWQINAVLGGQHVSLVLDSGCNESLLDFDVWKSLAHRPPSTRRASK